jgi:uncharacterized MAPEG superfamily protein
MSIAYWCVLGTIVYPYIFTTLAKAGTGFDNHNPREYCQRLEGWRKRAYWVQLNCFEVNPAFFAAVIVAHQLQVSQLMIDRLAIVFVLSRIVYAVAYIIDLATLRTLFWIIGFGCVISLFFV